MSHNFKAYDLVLFSICVLFTSMFLASAYAGETPDNEKTHTDFATSAPAMEKDHFQAINDDVNASSNAEKDASSTDENMNNAQNPIQTTDSGKTSSAPDMDKSAADQLEYPGVINRSIVRRPSDAPSLEIYYPVFGQPKVDEAIRKFAETQADEYEKDVAEAISPDEERPAAYEQWEMTGYYTLERPNPDVVSVIFNIFSYSGGAHGNLVITCMNFNLRTGERIEFADLFKDPEKALEMMSSFSAKKLTSDLGEYADEDMIHSGTEPDLANFSNLTLFPNGIYIEFQPYQVGPWAAGPQRVEMTLQDLAAAGPEPDIWPDAASFTPPAPSPKPESETSSPIATE